MYCEYTHQVLRAQANTMLHYPNDTRVRISVPIRWRKRNIENLVPDKLLSPDKLPLGTLVKIIGA